jgi:protoporphyrinogen/coproporphyrinogen III oxidase
VSGTALVVGAGLAGLTAAFRLQCAGLRVTVLDARSDLAGAGDDVTLAPLEAALPESAPALHGLACELGMAKQLRRVAVGEVELYSAAGSAELRALDGAEHCVGARGPLGWLRLHRLRRLMRWYGPYLEPDAPELGERLDDRSVADWCRLYLGRRALESLGPLLAAHYGLDLAQASRLLALSLLDPLGAARVAQPLGLAELRRALAARLPDLRTGQRAVRVASDGRVRLESGAELRADVAVLALPSAAVRACAEGLRPAERSSLERMTTGARVQLALRVRRPPLRAAVCWIGSDRALAGIVDCTALAGDLAAPERALALLAHPHLAETSRERSDAALSAQLLAAAERYLPGLGAGRPAGRLWRRDVPRFDVGHYRAVARLRAEAPLATDRAWVQGGHDLVAPHAEGAVVAGTRAAEEALRLRARRS